MNYSGKAKYGDVQIVRKSFILQKSSIRKIFMQMTKWLLLFHIWDTSSVHRYLNLPCSNRGGVGSKGRKHVMKTL